MQKRNIVLLLLMLLFALLLAACGEDDTEDTAENDNDNNTAATDIPTAEAPDAAAGATAEAAAGGIEGNAEAAVAALLAGDFETANTYFCDDSQFDETTVEDFNTGDEVVNYDVTCRTEGATVVCNYSPEIASADTTASGAATESVGTDGATTTQTAPNTGSNQSTPAGNPAAGNQTGQQTNASGSTTLSTQGSSAGGTGTGFQMTIPVVNEELCGEYTISAANE